MTWAIIVGVVAASTAATIALVFGVRRWIDPEMLGHQERRAEVFAFAGVLYALVVGFVLAFALDGYKAAEQGANTEADSIVALSRSATLFDAESRDAIGHQLVCYARAVIDDEWPAMVGGRPSESTTATTDRLFQSFGRLARANANAAGLGSALERVDTLGKARSDRLLQSKRRLPAMFWLFMVGGGIMLICYSAVLAARERPFWHVILVLPVVILLASSLYLVASFERPFHGPTALEPDAMQHALRSVEAFVPDPRANRPCP